MIEKAPAAEAVGAFLRVRPNIAGATLGLTRLAWRGSV